MGSVAEAIGDWLAASSAITTALGGDRIYRDHAPEATSLAKHIVVHEGIVRSKIHREAAKNELAQVDLWQRQVDDDGTLAEDPTLIDLVEQRLDEAVINGGPSGRMSTELVSSIRLLEQDTGLVHHAVTVRVSRTP